MAVDVTPMLVIWGPGRPDITTTRVIDGVLVVAGPNLGAALAAMEVRPEAFARDTVIDALDEFVTRRDEHDARKRTSGARTAAV